MLISPIAHGTSLGGPDYVSAECEVPDCGRHDAEDLTDGLCAVHLVAHNWFHYCLDNADPRTVAVARMAMRVGMGMRKCGAVAVERKAVGT